MDWREATVSALDWWRDAGVDIVVGEDARDWTVAETGKLPGTARDAEPQPQPVVETPLPATLKGFLDWRSGGDAPESKWGEPLLPPMGDPAATLMIVTDLPEADDSLARVLLSGPAGRLFDRMLAAIGLDRDTVYLVPLCLARPVTGQVPPDDADRLAQLLHHHIALAAPQRLLVLGQTASRAVFGAGAASWRGRLQQLNYQGGQSAAVATFHPRFLLTKPTAKADAWKDLQLLIGGQSS